MKASSLPTKVQTPFASGSNSAFIRTVPVPSQQSITTGAASFTDGFPPVCFQDPGAGGIPPAGPDFQYLFNLTTAWNQWQAAGGLVPYDATFSNQIGGYPAGATVLSVATPGRIWVSTADNNAVNPDSAGQTAWLALMLASDVLALAPQIATGNPIIYVSTSGNDTTGNGTSSAPFASIQAALTYGVSRYVFAGFTLTVQLQTAGTYAMPTNIPRGCGNLAIVGSTSNPAGYVLSGAGSAAAGGVLTVSGVSLSLSGLTLLNSSNITNTLTASNGGSVNLAYVRLQLATTLNGSHIYSAPGGSVVIGQGCSIVNGGSTYALAAVGGSIVLGGYQVTVGNGAAFSGAFAFAQGSGGNISASSGTSFSAPSVTGQTYNVSLNASINTFGGGPNFFPGSTAGTYSSGGQYA